MILLTLFYADIYRPSFNMLAGRQVGGITGMASRGLRSGRIQSAVNIVALFLLVVGTSALSIFIFDRYTSTLIPDGSNIVVRANYTNVLWQSYGEVFEPMVKIPMMYPNEGYRDQDFLLDSGAVISSLPRERAADLGISLAKLPRIVFNGFGGTTSFAYQSTIQIMVGGDEVTIPVVFTEAAGTKPILGRSGFFESYSVYFNGRTKKIEITKV